VRDHLKSSRYRILALFYSPDLVLRPSEIIQRTNLPPETVRAMLKRMVHEKQIFHICHSQYSRSPEAKPLVQGKHNQVALFRRLDALERRVEELERKTGTLV